MLQTRTIELAPLDLRAAVGAVDSETRTVRLTFSSGADVIRYDWMSGKRYIERLSLDPKHVRLARLNSGAPLLNTHSAWSLADQIGVVEDDSAAVDGKSGVAAVRFSKRADVEPYYQDVLDRIIRNNSVGYRVHRYEESVGKNELPVRLATDWEPYEISMCPMGADMFAQTRSGKPAGQVRTSREVETNPCVLVTRAIDVAAAADADRARRYRRMAAGY